MGTGIIVCGHGSRSLAGRTAVSRLVTAMRRQAIGHEVVDAFVDVRQPSLVDVVAQTRGPRVIVPLALGHDATLQTHLSRVRSDLVSIAPPVGPDWVLAELGVQRLIEAGARPSDTIVLVAPRVDGPSALADVAQAARFLSAVWGGPVHVGIVEGDGTPVDEALDVARAHGRRVVVAWYSLEPFEDAPRIGDLGADVMTAPLMGPDGPDPRLVSLVLERALNPVPHGVGP